MVQVRMKNWLELDRDWPYNEGVAGDGPVVANPRGSLCHIFPVVDPNAHSYYHPWIELDLEQLIEQLDPASHDGVGGPKPTVGGQ